MRIADVAIRVSIALTAVALLGGELAACGGSGGNTASTPTVRAGAHAALNSRIAAARRALRDYDGDGTDDPRGTFFDSDDHGVLNYGHAADASDRKTIAAVVERYYQAAAADDGAVACKLIDPGLASALPQVNDSKPDSPTPSGVSCATAISRLFLHVPGRSSGRLAAVKVVGVRVQGGNGLALLRLASSEARYIPVAREGDRWTLQALFDTGLI
jgi:hypothetical protein